MQDLEFKSKKAGAAIFADRSSYAFSAVCIIYIIFSLSAFIIPENILDISPVCLNFVNFMKNYFPNIEIIGSISPYTQLSEFYVSIMWIFGIFIFCLLILFQIVWIGFYERYDDDSKNDANNKKEASVLLMIFGISLGIFMFCVYYTGYFASSGISIGARHFMPEFQSRFSIFGYITFFQSAFSFSGIAVLVFIYGLIRKIYSILKGAKDVA
nr:hypothetical protein [uncultured Campylobacter sp.]